MNTNPFTKVRFSCFHTMAFNDKAFRQPKLNINGKVTLFLFILMKIDLFLKINES